MIVVATHDSIKFLHLSINNMRKVNLNGHRVLFIDTNSKDIEFKKEFEIAKNNNPEFLFESLDYTCWDSGAYIYAFEKYKADSYIFLQDSLEILDKDYICCFDDQLKNFDVIGHFPFDYFYDNEEQKIWVESDIKFDSYPKHGIFGPIFAATSNILERLPKECIKYPTNKNQGCGMERRWSLMFHSIGATKTYLENDDLWKKFSEKYIHKHFPTRL